MLSVKLPFRSFWLKTNNLVIPKSGLHYVACFQPGAIGNLRILPKASRKKEPRKRLDILGCVG